MTDAPYTTSDDATSAAIARGTLTRDYFPKIDCNVVNNQVSSKPLFLNNH